MLSACRLTNLISVPTRRSKRKVQRWLEAQPMDTLFLDLPADWQRPIDQILEGHRPARVVEAMTDDGLVRHPEDSQMLRAYEPVLTLLYALGQQGVHFVCYLDPTRHAAARDLAGELLALTLRAKLGRIDVERWRELIMEDIETSLDWSVREARAIASRARGESVALDVSAEAVEYLDAAGFHVEEVELDRSCKPLDILRSKLSQELLQGVKVSVEEVAALVHDHVRFVDLLLGREYEYAYEVWEESYGRRPPVNSLRRKAEPV